MISAVVTSDYTAAQSIQRGLDTVNLKTLVYRIDFSIVDHYEFIYHDGFFVYLKKPTEQHVNFCTHLKNIAPGKRIFILADTSDVGILNSLKECVGSPIFSPPFAFRNIAGMYQSVTSNDLGYVQKLELRDVIVKLDAAQRRLCLVDGSFVELKNKEFFILKFLFTHKGRIVSKIDLLEFVWGKNLLGSTHTIDVHMSHLRRKLKNRLDFDPIKTVHCAGYILE
jgi:two-component system, OmpR family, response regulator